MVKLMSATNHSISVKMPRKKTSLNIDSDVWKRWLTFVIQKTAKNERGKSVYSISTIPIPYILN
jgi:hypothetical protein